MACGQRFAFCSAPGFSGSGAARVIGDQEKEAYTLWTVYTDCTEDEPCPTCAGDVCDSEEDPT